MRALAFALVAAAAMSLTGLAGWWQWQRFESRQESIAQFDAGAASDPLTAAEVAGADPVDARYYSAEVVGAFAPGSETLLRNRNVGGRPATGLLAWFVSDAGPLLVHVGWLEYEPGADAPALPAGEFSLELTLQVIEPDDGRRSAGATRITPAQMPSVSGEPLPLYGVVSGGCADCVALTAAVGAGAADVERPSPGPHLSYSLQWWTLTLLIPVGAVLLARRDRDEEAPGRPAPRPAPRRRRLSDEEIEDAL